MAISNKTDSSFFQRVIRGIGPAIIVACIVLGPGSILTSSKVGCQFGFELAWILVAAGVLMFGAIATASRVGVSLEQSPFTELACRLGRPFAVLVGINVFLIASCFQYSNNLGVLAAIEPLVELTPVTRALILLGLNLFIVACLFGVQKLYRRIEHLMMFLMGLMLLGFLVNLMLARPSLIGLLAGLVPGLPDGLSGGFFPRLEAASDSSPPTMVDPWITVQGLIVTSFSIAGAFYQAHLVREKGWTTDQTRHGLVDSFIGTAVLIGVTLMIMATSATVLSKRIAPEDLKSAGDVAIQLEPLFGSAAKWLFCIGILAGAISSFLVNSILGGTFLADGLGQNARIDSKWTKIYTIGALAIGMVVALVTTPVGRVPLIIFAQAMTVLGGPLLAFSLLYLGIQKESSGKRIADAWMIGLTAIGAIVVMVLAMRTLFRICLATFG